MGIVRVYVRVDVAQIPALGIQDGALVWILYLILRTTRRARQIAKAHLMLIHSDAIIPMSTPIYQKLRLYELFLYLVVIAFIIFLAMNMFLISANVQAWVITLTKSTVQFMTIVAIMIMYRPRGRHIDRYMVQDVAEDGRDRDQVLLEDLESFELNTTADGMREWEEGMALPLQPSSYRPRTRRRQRARATNLTRPSQRRLRTPHQNEF
jgi:hypothetical protein